ncbi:type II toxin-antitoxin system Phd/YefM family antitoxin [Endozoicomonas sp. SM1973]|uniref:Antitoxin n=1 Tax=Spartinivicinus marinus TaxID=2994442 RepID=A0A853I940_9GAMM|nr:type II toxin-antitoxin system prevent-host-death family antitoxin [Spartinivicinus marinus]NYZ69823.1 type II toxin-antitoxin system Phd/YefM family antitoxin [Spartinivicinus marinus]
MNNEVGSYEAKTKLPELLRRVEAGESFTITNRGKVVADLIPADSRRQRAKLAIANIKRMKKHVVSDEDLMEMKQEGRK